MQKYSKIVYEGIKNIQSWPGYIIDYLESRDQEFLKDLFSVSVQEISDLEDFIYLPSSIADFIEDKKYCRDILLRDFDKLTEAYPINRIFEILTPGHIRVEILKDKELVNEIINKYIGKAETSEDFRAMGDFALFNSKDEELASEMYKKAQNKAESFDDFRNLGWSIGYELNDPVWAFEILMRAASKAENNEQVGLLLSCANNIDLDEPLFLFIQQKCFSGGLE